MDKLNQYKKNKVIGLILMFSSVVFVLIFKYRILIKIFILLGIDDIGIALLHLFSSIFLFGAIVTSFLVGIFIFFINGFKYSKLKKIHERK